MEKKYREFTKEEINWINSFQRCMNKAPKNLFIFAGSGAFVVYPKDENGDRYMTSYGGVDQEPDSINVTMPCESDGGDW